MLRRRTWRVRASDTVAPSPWYRPATHARLAPGRRAPSLARSGSRRRGPQCHAAAFALGQLASPAVGGTGDSQRHARERWRRSAAQAKCLGRAGVRPARSHRVCLAYNHDAVCVRDQLAARARTHAGGVHSRLARWAQCLTTRSREAQRLARTERGMISLAPATLVGTMGAAWFVDVEDWQDAVRQLLSDPTNVLPIELETRSHDGPVR